MAGPAGSDDHAGIHPVVVGTAGHIDHGKSTLVRALTGIDPDRLKEEKERGLTIDLGFARFPLPDGRLVGMVDVPGHERFVRNMVAGSTGLDLAVLVVAADDGVMPQTIEHLEVLDLLGVDRGLVALTKVDLVDDETRELAEDEVRELLAGTRLAEARIFPISAVKDRGMEEFKAALVQLASETEPREGRGPFRMPIQRVFALEGIGTVVTGIPLTGSVASGEEVEFQPSGARSRVRHVQAYGATVERAVAGHSTAISVPDARRDELVRGDVVVAPGAFPSGDGVDVELRVLAGVGFALPHRMPVRFHVGTVERRGLLQLLDATSIEPGEEVVARIRLEQAVCCAHGDPFLLRSMTPPRTIAGGRVLRLIEAPSRYRRASVADELESLLAAGDDPAARVAEAVARGGGQGTTPGELSAGLGLAVDQVEDAIAADASLYVHKKSGRVFTRATLERGKQHVEDSVTKILARRNLAASLERSALRTGRELPPALKDAVLDELVRSGAVRSGLQGRLLFLDRLAPLADDDRARFDKLVAVCDEAGCKPPAEAELAEVLGLPAGDGRVGRLVARALDEERCVRIGDHLWSTRVLWQVLHSIRDNCLEHDGILDIPQLRDGLVTSRKWLIPLLEHVDGMGLTVLRAGTRHLLTRSDIARTLEERRRDGDS